MYKYLELTIQLFLKANFNDTYYHYLEKIYFDLDKLINDKIVWIDPYNNNNKSKNNNTFIAIKSYSTLKNKIVYKSREILVFILLLMQSIV